LLRFTFAPLFGRKAVQRHSEQYLRRVLVTHARRHEDLRGSHAALLGVRS
jgi:hypothetical protein